MLQLSREQILGHRRRVSALGTKLVLSAQSLERAAAAGLQDSMPRAALLSIHARVSDVSPATLEQPPLVQVWGPRYSAYVIAEHDLALFTLGRLPESSKGRRRAEDVAQRLQTALAGERMDVRDAARTVGLHPNALRYAAPTGRFLIHWDGARQPLIWSVRAPQVDPRDARLDLARRYLHVFGPGTPESFASWAGVRPTTAATTFEDLGGELTASNTPIGEAWILASDESSFRQPSDDAPIRLLPSGDTYFLFWGEDRALLVADESRRERLWTSRVWPGAVLVHEDIVGIWRRSQHEVRIQLWDELPRASRNQIEQEAASMPLPGIERAITVTWDET